MKKCYTVGSIQNISDFYDVVQFTENQRTGLYRRQTSKTVEDLRKSGVTCKIIVHQDFIYIASRYLLFSKDIQESIISYLKTYDGVDVSGIVMHTDFPIRKEILRVSDKQAAINECYSRAIWNHQLIMDAVVNNDAIVEKSIVAMAQDMVNAGVTTRVFLENTTNTGPNGESTINWLINLFIKYPNLSKVFGIAYDTCHQYAVDGTWLSVDDIININTHVCPILVHLNTIPSEVTPGSRRDRHSLTTIYECSVNTNDYYKQYAEALDRNNITWVREVKEETIKRELDQLDGKQ